MSKPHVQRRCRTTPSLPVEAEIRRLTRRSFTVGAYRRLAGAAGVGWLATRPEDDGVPWPLRRILEFNERVARRVLQAHAAGPGVSRHSGGRHCARTATSD